MAGINIEISGLNQITTKLKQFPAEVEKVLQKNLNEFAVNTASDAQGFCPVNEGYLRQSIHPEIKRLEAGVTVSANYAAYVEFGTRKYAAAHVATLPADWQAFAAKFKGKGQGDFYDFLNAILDWVIRKGIASRYSVKTKKAIAIKIGGKGKQSLSDQDRLEKTAYAIALNILRNGIKAQPFLYPAVNINRDKLENNLKAAFG